MRTLAEDERECLVTAGAHCLTTTMMRKLPRMVEARLSERCGFEGPSFVDLVAVLTKSNCDFWKNIHQSGSHFENGTPNAVGKMKRILEGDVKRDAWSKILRRGESQVKKVAMVTSL